jgi:hypothetical protein
MKVFIQTGVVFPVNNSFFILIENFALDSYVADPGGRGV